jgi:hypothetical protein
MNPLQKPKIIIRFFLDQTGNFYWKHLNISCTFIVNISHFKNTYRMVHIQYTLNSHPLSNHFIFVQQK